MCRRSLTAGTAAAVDLLWRSVMESAKLLYVSETTSSQGQASGPDQRAGHAGMETKFVVGRASDLADGDRLVVEVHGRSIGIFKVDDRYYAMLNRCPHGGAELCKGEIVDLLESERPGEVRLDRSRKFIACPWHGWEYELETGQSWFDPVRTRARMFEVGVSSGGMLAGDLGSGAAAVPDDLAPRVIDAATHRVKGPYTAEMLPVEVEDDYIVVSLRPPAAATAGSSANKESS
jgi:nitrite reductase/ring-hydroxylating ferredoxin subunit